MIWSVWASQNDKKGEKRNIKFNRGNNKKLYEKIDDDKETSRL